jgi:hypothetical protein
MLETHIVMSSLMFCLSLILVLHLVFTLELLFALSHVLCLTLLLVLCLSSLMDPTIAHMILVNERTALSLDALVMTHILIVVTISRVGLVFPLEGPFPTLSRHLDGPHFPRRGSRPTRPSGEVQRTMKTSSSRMVKCWISKIYLTNSSTEPSTFSHPM